MQGDFDPLSPTMGVLIPPSASTSTLSYSRLPMNEVDGPSSYEAPPSPEVLDGDVSSPEGTPAPGDNTCIYDQRYTWQPPPDVYSISHYQYPQAAQSPHIQPVSTGIPLEAYGYR